MRCAGWQAGDASTGPRPGAFAAGQEEIEAKSCAFLRQQVARYLCQGSPQPLGASCPVYKISVCVLGALHAWHLPITRARNGCTQ